MFLRPDDQGRGRIVGATVSQVRGHDMPTLSIDVQQGTHIASGIHGAPREAYIHGAQIKVYGDAVVPFMAQLLANGIPVFVYPANGGDEAAWLAYVQRDRTVPDTPKARTYTCTSGRGDRCTCYACHGG